MGQLQVLQREYIDTEIDAKMEQEKNLCLILFISFRIPRSTKVY